MQIEEEMIPTPKPIRKPNHRHHGMQVTICGRPLRTPHTPHNLICSFQTRHPGNIHATVAIADDGSVVAIVDDLSKDEVEMWQLVDAPHE